jgi:excisionase family DNA binding protein
MNVELSSLTDSASSRFVTAREVAKRLDVCVETVRNYVREGKLPAFRVRRMFRFEESDVDAFVARHKG